ncbi:GNAT family N-acetyltransferase [Flavobacterium johnsoniae]|uniref:hypothetical protein n=1 Tax=Flavobacterium johnsoniae TaxID=986 RepID=UPI00223AE33E|nr:hypothetical protein [Flavobacterium johnsoniae]
MEYLIRKCEIADLPKLVILCQKHADFEKADYSPEGKEEGLKKALFSENPKLHCLVVAVKNTIVGYVSYTFDFSTWNTADFLYMDVYFWKKKHAVSGLAKF